MLDKLLSFPLNMASHIKIEMSIDCKNLLTFQSSQIFKKLDRI